MKKIGLVVHLEKRDLEIALAQWEIQVSNEQVEIHAHNVTSFKYLALEADGCLRALAVVSSWIIGMEEKTACSAKFSRVFQSNLHALEQELRPNLLNLEYLIQQQDEAIYDLLSSPDKSCVRPEKPIALDLDAAAQAVSNYYRVKRDQVDVSIKFNPGNRDTLTTLD